jgi:hypothetical protein
MPHADRAVGRWLSWPWLPLLALAAALWAAAGFVLALSVLPDRRGAAASPRAWMGAFAAGAAFPWLSGMMLPAFAALRAGAWPLEVWWFAGSMAAAAGVRLLFTRRPSKETT